MEDLITGKTGNLISYTYLLLEVDSYFGKNRYSKVDNNFGTEGVKDWTKKRLWVNPTHFATFNLKGLEDFNGLACNDKRGGKRFVGWLMSQRTRFHFPPSERST